VGDCCSGVVPTVSFGFFVSVLMLVEVRLPFGLRRVREGKVEYLEERTKFALQCGDCEWTGGIWSAREGTVLECGKDLRAMGLGMFYVGVVGCGRG